MAGRTSEPRTFSVTKTSGSAAITAAAGSFNHGDVGTAITGTGIPANATILSVTSSTAATLSANATATGATSCTLADAGDKYGFRGYSVETDAEADSYSVTAFNAATATPDVRTNTTTGITRRSRS